MSGRRHVTDDDIRNAVRRLAKKNGFLKRADVVTLLKVTPPIAYRILKRLVKDGVLRPDGKGAGARYVPA